MVSIENVRVGNLLVSDNGRLYCVVKIIKERNNPEGSVIVGADEVNKLYIAPVGRWFYLWDRPLL